MVAVYEIPLSGHPQRFGIALGTTPYTLQFQFRNPGKGGEGGDWIMDIFDATGAPIVCGIPLVTGADLLAQYDYLGFEGALVVRSEGDPDARPTFDGLGLSSRLYWLMR